jgi:hypothetical protein
VVSERRLVRWRWIQCVFNLKWTMINHLTVSLIIMLMVNNIRLDGHEELHRVFKVRCTVIEFLCSSSITIVDDEQEHVR